MEKAIILQDVKTKKYYANPYSGEIGFTTDINEAKHFDLSHQDNFEFTYQWEEEELKANSYILEAKTIFIF